MGMLAALMSMFPGRSNYMGRGIVWDVIEGVGDAWKGCLLS